MEGNGSTNSLMGITWQIYIYLRGCTEAKHYLFTSCALLCTQKRMAFWTQVRKTIKKKSAPFVYTKTNTWFLVKKNHT